MYVLAQKQTGMSGACKGPACGYRRRRRGFGAVSCPGDPSCPGYVDPYLNAAMQGGGTCNCVNGVCTDAANLGNSCGALTTAQSAAQAQQAYKGLSGLNGYAGLAGLARRNGWR